jgi:hypothetical protein
MRPLLAVLTCLMLFTTPVVAGDWEDAVTAWHAGASGWAIKALPRGPA